MCNAHNHDWSCTCGFGGDTGGGGGWRRARHATEVQLISDPISAGWAQDSSGTVTSYVNPNAHCPVCHEPVFFYRSPYNGRVFFDELGWPWPKHHCTDNSLESRRTTRESVLKYPRRNEPRWQQEGWHPFRSLKVYSAQDRLQITGDVENDFLELYLFRGERIDPKSPTLVRRQPEKPDIFKVSFLTSDAFGTRSRTTLAYPERLASLGEDTIRAAKQNDPIACNTIGQFLLALDDPISATPYLQIAAAAGIIEALIDLAIMLLMLSSKDV
jgi:hypothetical protein